MNLFIQNGNRLSRFISAVDNNGTISFNGITTICENAFMTSNGVKNIHFDGNLRYINKSAFEDAKSLENFYCCKELSENENSLANILLAIASDDFTIQTSAFSGCKNLQTVILPSCKKLTIEKDAFSGCDSLRTFVCECEEISFTENPFADCPENLVFVVKNGSELERFAREHEYRFINA